jgi:DNA polymerase V
MTKRTRAHAIKKEKNHPPLYTSPVAAGFPVPGDDAIERGLSIDEYLVPNFATTFFVRASGNSMIDAHIVSDDILVVDRALAPTPGVIVVVAVYGELVVKRLMKEGKTFLLASDNRAYEPIPLTEDAVVWGVVVGVVRKLR